MRVAIKQVDAFSDVLRGQSRGVVLNAEGSPTTRRCSGSRAR